MKKPELMAPAGNLDSLKTAVRAGADSVYIGGKDFSARQRAKNFDEEELIQSIRFCHRYG
ncbi:MAG TPA: peptidase U32, partial [Eubacteriaceae bacterium]|nr:peptidase U32 [Eubacteriaceae bacterium]